MNFVFILGLENPVDYNWTNSVAESLLPLSPTLKIKTLTGLALFYAFIFWVNKRALNKDVLPTLERIEKMQLQIKND